MYINKAIRTIMKSQNVTLDTMAKILWNDGVTKSGKGRTGNSVSSRLLNSNMTFNLAVEMLSGMGYEIVVQKKTQGLRQAGQIVIDQKDDVDLDELLSE